MSYSNCVHHSLVMWGVLLCSATALAGTTTIDFTQDLGNLVQRGGSGSLTIDENCDGVFTGTPTYLVGSGASGGTSSITMDVTPASDVTGNNLGLVMIDDDDGEFVTATVSNSGLITLSNSYGSPPAVTIQMPAPAAGNAAFTLEYNATTDTARVTVAGFSANGSISPAFPAALDSVRVEAGVLSFGGGTFRGLSSTGSGIPELDSTGVCSSPEGEGEGDGEGLVEGEGEGVSEGEGEGMPEGEGEVACPVCIPSETSYFLVGESACLHVPDPVLVDSTYLWSKDGVPLGNGGQHQGVSCRSLLIHQLLPSNAGTYTCAYDDGAKAPAEYSIAITVDGTVPAAGLGGLALLAAGVTLAGGFLSARRKR